jgi:lysophospholipase L1-like esterase
MQTAPSSLRFPNVAALLLTTVILTPVSASGPALPKIAQKLAAKEPLTIACLGDSVTGVYYHTGGRRAYPEMVAVALRQVHPDAPVTIVNAGISGNTTIDALNRLKKDVLDKRPDLVTVMFGLNDMVRVPLADYQANLKSIIEQCRAAGAQVMLCTPNAIIDSGGRSTEQLVNFCAAMREVGKQLDVPVCDCYAAHVALRDRDALAWRLMMSDAIHPNMDGHKLNAIAICQSLTGSEISLADEAPPQPAIPKTLSRVKAGEPVRILAMTPYDTLIADALRSVAPEAKIEVAAWPTDGQSLAQLEEASKTVRGRPIDLVFVAVPAAVTPADNPPPEDAINHYTWILNWSLSFGYQEWDVVGIAPSVLNTEYAAAGGPGAAKEAFARRLIAAQDLSAIIRPADSTAPPAAIVEAWLREQLAR